jgi:pilus assembly protein Flp/PilA
MLILSREEGQGLAEYGLILVLIAVIVALAVTLLGQNLSELFSRVVNSF